MEHSGCEHPFYTAVPGTPAPRGGALSRDLQPFLRSQEWRASYWDCQWQPRRVCGLYYEALERRASTCCSVIYSQLLLCVLMLQAGLQDFSKSSSTL